MKKIKLLLLTSIAIPCLFSCGKKTQLTVTFKQQGMDDVIVNFDKNTLKSEIELQEPELISKEGYYVSWEEYSIADATQSIIVKAKYTPITFYVDFKAQGVLVESVPFTIEDIYDSYSKLPLERTPEVPYNAWADGYWENYSLSLNNIVVNAKYNNLRKFKVDFIAEGNKVCDPITITLNDLDAEGKIKSELIPSEVLEYEVPDHDVIWDFEILKAADTVVTAEIPFHSYYIEFLDFDGERFGDLAPYTIENDSWESVNKPEAPEKEGYITGWNDAVLTYDDNDIVSVTPKLVEGIEYKISFDGFEGIQSIKYGENYVLEHKSSILKAWVDENENIIPNSGTWLYPENKNLTLIDSEVDQFLYNGVPDFIDVNKSFNIASMETVEEEGINNSKALKIVVENDSDFGVKIKKEYLDEVFSNSSVKALTMVMKASAHNNNFRHKTNNLSVCYELNNVKFGLETYYKKFSFTKDMYLAHNDDTDFVIFGGKPDEGSCAGLEIYIDSFIFLEDDVLKDFDTKLSFEAGSTGESTGANVENSAYTPFYNGSGEIAEDRFFIQHAASISVTNVGHSNEFVTDGLSSFTFEKGNGYISVYFGKSFTEKIENSASRKVAFDIYSTVYINSNDTASNITDGKNGLFTKQGGKLQDHKWTTFIFEAGVNFTGSSDSGRFLIIQGSSAGTFYIDNIRILPLDNN